VDENGEKQTVSFWDRAKKPCRSFIRKVLGSGFEKLSFDWLRGERPESPTPFCGGRAGLWCSP